MDDHVGSYADLGGGGYTDRRDLITRVLPAGSYIVQGSAQASSLGRMLWTCSVTVGGITYANGVAQTGGITNTYTTVTISADTAFTLAQPTEVALTCSRLQLVDTDSAEHSLGSATMLISTVSSVEVAYG